MSDFPEVPLPDLFWDNVVADKYMSRTNDHSRRRNEGADEETENEYPDDESETFDEVHVGDLDSLGGTDAEDHGDSGGEKEKDFSENFLNGNVHKSSIKLQYITLHMEIALHYPDIIVITYIHSVIFYPATWNN